MAVGDNTTPHNIYDDVETEAQHEYETLNEHREAQEYEVIQPALPTRNKKSPNEFEMTDCSAYGAFAPKT